MVFVNFFGQRFSPDFSLMEKNTWNFHRTKFWITVNSVPVGFFLRSYNNNQFLWVSQPSEKLLGHGFDFQMPIFYRDRQLCNSKTESEDFKFSSCARCQPASGTPNCKSVLTWIDTERLAKVCENIYTSTWICLKCHGREGNWEKEIAGLEEEGRKMWHWMRRTRRMEQRRLMVTRKEAKQCCVLCAMCMCYVRFWLKW